MELYIKYRNLIDLFLKDITLVKVIGEHHKVETVLILYIVQREKIC